MATFTLTDLKNEVSKKYAPTVIENGDKTYTLQNLMQIGSEDRDKVLELIEDIDSENKTLDDQIAVFRSIVEIVEENGNGGELLELLGDNTALVMELVNTWMDGTQLGEAER